LLPTIGIYEGVLTATCEQVTAKASFHVTGCIYLLFHKKKVLVNDGKLIKDEEGAKLVVQKTNATRIKEC